MIPRNKLSVINNPYQGNPQRVLCVCSGGVLRSPTAAWILSNEPFNFNTRSCGDKDYALIPLTEELVQWANEIVVMDAWQEQSVLVLLDALDEKRVIHVMDIEDDYDYRDPELVMMMTKYFMEAFL